MWFALLVVVCTCGCLAHVNHVAALLVAIVCTHPTTAGYDTATDGQMSLVIGWQDPTDGACTTDHYGSVTYTACTTSGDYSVGGCTGDAPSGFLCSLLFVHVANTSRAQQWWDLITQDSPPSP
jgi:hypothetical protein